MATFAIYGGLCGATERLAGSFQPVVPTLHSSPPQDWNLKVVITSLKRLITCLLNSHSITPNSMLFPAITLSTSPL
ncbi:hypothetical protein D8682_25090 [Buttiauxella sp. 3AFRM03]|nr:hypothetical protein D8682_25090 [Buttiauxella sp. 3AFRM03]